MKKLLVLLLVCALTLGLCACAPKINVPSVKTAEDLVEDAVYSKIMLEILFDYDDVSVNRVTYYIDEINDSKYELTGKITVRDKYGDTYTGKYDCIVSYNSKEDKYEVKELDIGTLYKD